MAGFKLKTINEKRAGWWLHSAPKAECLPVMAACKQRVSDLGLLGHDVSGLKLKDDEGNTLSLFRAPGTDEPDKTDESGHHLIDWIHSIELVEGNIHLKCKHDDGGSQQQKRHHEAVCEQAARNLHMLLEMHETFVSRFGSY